MTFGEGGFWLICLLLLKLRLDCGQSGCGSDSDCGANMHCVGGQCVCNDGYVCQNGDCVPVTCVGCGETYSLPTNPCCSGLEQGADGKCKEPCPDCNIDQACKCRADHCNCECVSNTPGGWTYIPNVPDCPPGGSPTLLWQDTDQFVGNRLELWCKGYYSLEYVNASGGRTVTGTCIYGCGKNLWKYRKTSDGKAFYDTWHRTADNLDAQYPGDCVLDEGTLGVYDWAVTKYDALGDSEVSPSRICREGSDRNEWPSDEYGGIDSPCP